MSGPLTSTLCLLVLTSACLELFADVSAQQAASTNRKQPATSRNRQAPSSTDDVEALIAEARRSAADGGSIRITEKKEKSSMKTVYIDETDQNVGPDQLIHENIKIYIDADEERSKWILWRHASLLTIDCFTSVSAR